MSGGMRPAMVEQLGRRIRTARQDLELSVGALAERSDVSRRMLTQIELGQANPSVAILDRIAAGLGTTFAALMGMGSDAPPEGVEVWSAESGSWAVLLDAIDERGVSVETWKWKLVGEDVYEGDSGGADGGIMLHVIEGRLEIEDDRPVRVIEAGGVERSPSGGVRRYRSPDGAATVFLSVAVLPRSGAGR